MSQTTAGTTPATPVESTVAAPTQGVDDAESTPSRRRLVDLEELRRLVRQAGETRRGLTVQRVLELVAVALVPLGLSLIVLGWQGASNTILVPEQLPYLISGGLLGTALVVGGGLLYVGSWIARLAAQNREQAEALRDVVQALRDDLRGSGAVAGPSAASASPEASVFADPRHATGGDTDRPGAGAFVATPSGSMYHLPSCSVVASRDDVRAVDDDELDAMRACGMCAPERAA